jgi:hypothetical protein
MFSLVELYWREAVCWVTMAGEVLDAMFPTAMKDRGRAIQLETINDYTNCLFNCKTESFVKM